MSSLKITKKHHRHLNNPFPSAPKSLPFVQGTLFSESLTLATHQTFPIGKDFRLTWQSRNGGFLSVSHRLQPDKSLWSTIPGQAFVSGALAETEIQESRGSFVIKDREVRLVCDHQTIEDIRVIDHLDSFLHATDPDFPSGCVGFDQNDVKKTEFPVLMITGRIFSMKKKRPQDSSLSKKMTLGKDCTYARYWVFFGQKSSHQVGFQVRLGKPNFNLSQAISPAGLRRRQVLRLKLCQLRKKKLGWWWSFRRPRNYVAVSSAEDEIVGVKPPESTEFNRICLTYSSEKSEKFYGFGEQFSHMNFKGRRVPIFVQEQGIGRGDQPITFAANLVSHRLVALSSVVNSLITDGYNWNISLLLQGWG